MQQSFITIIIPSKRAKRAEIELALDRLDNPANENIRRAFRKSQRVHFISGALIYGDKEEDYFSLEMSVDGEINQALSLFDDKNTQLKSLLTPLFDLLECVGQPSSFLKQHMVKTGSGYFNTPGLNFSGSPGMRVLRILQDQQLARGIRDYFDQSSPSGSSLQILTQLRQAIEQDDHFTEAKNGAPKLQSLISNETAPILNKSQRKATHPRVISTIILKTITTLMWPLILLALLITYFTLPAFELSLAFLWEGAWKFSLLSLGLLIFATLTFFILLLRKEKNEGSDLSLPNAEQLSQARSREDSSYVQNHLLGVSTLKPGLLRKISIRLTFLIISQLARLSFRPGFLAEIGTIHFARWYMIPKTNKLIFCSNYGGSWESYLEDFITKATEGLTGVWSNTLGFPQAKLLFFKGASSGEAFKRWARRQQIPTRFWYCAYPDLTTERIRINAAIRHGLLTASTETQADEFMSLFASMSRPKTELERDEIQTLLFKGLGTHGQSACLLVRLPHQPEIAKAWLKANIDNIGFGGQVPKARIDQISFTANGLRKLDLDSETLAQFSYPFLQGMSHEDRSRVLADTGDDKPSRWKWGSASGKEDSSVDCAYLIYIPNENDDIKATKATLKKYCKAFETKITQSGGAVLNCVITSHLQDRKPKLAANGSCPLGNPDFPREPFGFVDGISQPIIKGLKRGDPASEETQHHVHAGEFILGYPDNRGTQTLMPTLDAALDPNKLLPDYRPDPAQTGSVREHLKKTAKHRAFARNGTYLVIRQLEQDVKRFEGFLEKAAHEHKDHKGLPLGYDHNKLKEFLAAKMVGRWKDGTSLIKFPFEPGTGWKGQKTTNLPDNEFLLGQEDPTGHLCPYGSHIRRCNPRDSFIPGDKEQLDIVNRHRLLRRGRFYTDPKAKKEGLFFMCFNADIERQFEFIQQTWCQSRKFMGLDNEIDPIIGRGQKMGRLTIPTQQGPIFFNGIPDIITVIGGGYFFMPSRAALNYLSSVKVKSYISDGIAT